MATQIVIDHRGDSWHFFDNSSADALAEAEKLFLKFTAKGYTAGVRRGRGNQDHRVRPTAEETLFFPRLVSGDHQVKRNFFRVGRCEGQENDSGSCGCDFRDLGFRPNKGSSSIRRVLEMEVADEFQNTLFILRRIRPLQLAARRGSRWRAGLGAPPQC